MASAEGDGDGVTDASGAISDNSRYFDTSGVIPIPKVATIASALIGSVILGYVWAVLGLFNSVLGGLWSTIDGVAVWLSKLVWQFFNLGIDPLDAAFAANADFLEMFGVWAQAVAVAEIGLLMWLLIWGALTVGRSIAGGGS